ncbi:MAG: sigma 54-interacting transcriptional regulator [Planctomycetaceae bacterium]|nr:sigma 54-interacting transcriptional regulator [Planctomycetaceae bacterium]
MTNTTNDQEEQRQHHDFFSCSKPPVFEPNVPAAWRTPFPSDLNSSQNSQRSLSWKAEMDLFQRKPSVVVICDDPISRYKTCRMLEQAEITTAVCTFSECFALPAPKRNDYNLYLIDLYGSRFPEEQLHKKLEKHFANFPVVTLDSERKTPERLMQIEQYSLWHLTKPYFPEEVVWAIQKLYHLKQLVYERDLYCDSVLHFPLPITVTGQSAGIQKLISDINRVATSNAPVLLLGEIGTRKELTANQIHFNSGRPIRYYHAMSLINTFNEMLQYYFFGCAPGVTEVYPYGHIGILELVSRGSFYIEFVEFAFPELQEALLSCIKHGVTYREGIRTPVPINLRFIFSTYTDLEELSRNGSFNRELCDILMENQILVPALRNCKKDIVTFFTYGIQWLSELYNRPVPKLDKAAMNKLLSYSWPFNTQELELAAKNAFFRDTDGIITEDDIIFTVKPFTFAPNQRMKPEQGRWLGIAGMSMNDVQRQAILETLAFCGGNKQHTAKMLGISEKTLYNKLKAYEIT